MPDNTAISVPPYSISWDASQFTVKKTIAKSKSEGEREELVGYYANLDHALYYGIVGDHATGLGATTIDKAIAAQQALWAEVKEVVGAWLPTQSGWGQRSTKPSSAPVPGATLDENQAATESSTATVARIASTRNLLPEERQPRRRTSPTKA